MLSSDEPWSIMRTLTLLEARAEKSVAAVPRRDAMLCPTVAMRESPLWISMLSALMDSCKEASTFCILPAMYSSRMTTESPWILFSAFPLAILTMISFVFIPFTSTAGKYVYIIFVVVLWNISMTMADIPSQGMLSLISKSSEEVNNAAGLGNTLKSIALAAPGVFVSFVCILTGSGGAVGQKEYLITAGIMAGLGLIFQLLMYFKCKEVVKSNSSAGMSFKEMFRELKNNKMLLIVFGTYLLGFGRNIGLGIAVQATCILVRDGIDLSFIGMGTLYGDACSWAIGITSAISSMVTIVLNPKTLACTLV